MTTNKLNIRREVRALGKPKKLSQKYQIVIPPSARDLLKVSAGDQLQFWEYRGLIIVTKGDMLG